MRRQLGTILRDARGANLVEYLIVVGFIGVVSIGGFRAFGSSVLGKAEDQAACVESFDCGPGAKQGAAALPPAGARGSSDRPRSTPPGWDGVAGGEGASSENFPGTPFAEGDGDGNPVHPNDVRQGGLGDCWVLAGLAAVARTHPDVVRNAVRDNGDGTYTVTFYEPRSWYDPRGPKKVEVTVTSDFPMKDGNPVFAKPGDSVDDDPELWVMIVEKAYAQYKGGYDALDSGGPPEEFLEALTGQDADIDGDSKYEKWRGKDMDGMADAFEDGKPIVAGTHGDPKGQLLKDGKLVTGHAYWVSGVDRKNKTVTVQNPWGYDDKGGITMTWEEFEQNFSQVTIGSND